jgi:hypothetical protein
MPLCRISDMLRAIALATLLVAPRIAPAAEPAPDLDLWIDRQLLVGALATTPFDALLDARSAPALAEVRTQLQRFAQVALHRQLSDAMSFVRSLRFQAYATGSGGQTHAAMAIRAGPLAMSLSEWLELLGCNQGLVPTKIGAIAGCVSGGGMFIGAREDDVLLGDRESIPAIAAAPVLERAPAMGVLTCSGAALRQMLGSEGLSKEQAALAAGLLPMPAGAAPRLEIRADAGAGGGWSSSCELRGIGPSALRPIGAQLAGALRSGQDVTVALGADRAWLGDLLAAALVSGPKGIKEGTPPAVASAIAAHCTGDALVQLKLAVAMAPSAALVVPVDDAAPIAAALAAMPDATSTLLADKTPCWQLQLDDMYVEAAAANGRLVIATDEETAEAALSAHEGISAPWTKADAAMCEADLPHIASCLMPIARMALGVERMPLADPLAPLRWMASRIQDGAESRALASEVDANGGLSAAINALCGGGIDRLGTVATGYRSIKGDAEAVLVVLTVNGYRLLSASDPGADRKVAALADAQLTVSSMRRVFGVGIDGLRILAIPDVPTLSAKWLPPIDVLVAHLRPYHLDVERTADAVLGHDRGTPLAGLCGALAAFDLYQSMGRKRDER